MSRDLGHGDLRLLHGVALADRDEAALEGLAVYRDAVRGADLILAAVAAADRALLVIEGAEAGVARMSTQNVRVSSRIATRSSFRYSLPIRSEFRPSIPPP